MGNKKNGIMHILIHSISTLCMCLGFYFVFNTIDAIYITLLVQISIMVSNIQYKQD